MSLFDSIGSFFDNEKSHIGNMFGDFAKSPGKTLAQFALGAEDPLGASLWSKALGTKFTPEVGQMGGETDAQYAKSRQQGVDTGFSQTLGQIANVVAAVWGGSEAAGALGGAAGSAGGGAEAGAGAGAGEGAGAGASATADSGSVNLFADAVPGAGGDVGATAGGAANGTAAAAGSGSGASSWTDYAKTAAKVLAPTVVSSLLQPKPPKTKAPTAMPDPLAQQQAQQQKLIQQLARRGRASTILTSPGNSGGSLGG
jgi:hypothetical protein